MARGFVAALLLGCTGCAGLQVSPSSGVGSDAANLLRETKAPAAVYVTDFRTGNVWGYRADGGMPVFEISNLTQPTGIAIDSKANLYVANGGADEILVYASGQTSPKTTIADSGGAPSDVAVDAKGHIWATNNSCVSGSCGEGNLQEYSSSGKLKHDITCSTMYNYYFVTVDASDDAFIAGYNSSNAPVWYEIRSGGTKCRQLSVNLTSPGGLITTSDGNLIAVDRSSHVAYTYKAPTFTEVIAKTRLKGTYNPGSIALTKSGKKIWIVDQGRNVADKFAYPGGGSASVILNGLYEPVGVAVVE